MNKKVAIVGAGLTGLVAGYRLAKKGYRVEIFEKSSDIGGLMGGFEVGGTSLEKAYHHIFRTDTEIIKLAKELGLENKIRWQKSSIGLYYGGKLFPFAGAIDLLKFTPLTLVSKVRLGLVKIWLEKDNDWRKYIKVPAFQWMKDRCGEQAYKVIWEPLLKGKFHEHYKQVSMAWLWARIHTRANSKDRDGVEKLGYFEGGFRIISDELAKRIKAHGGKISLNYEAELKDIENKYDMVLYTGAAKGVDYLGAVCVVFTSKQSLSKYYWHNINDTDSPFLAFIQHTNLIEKSNYNGAQVYYLGTYIPHDHKYFGSDDSVVYSDFFGYLKKVFPKFDESQINEKWIFRLKNAQHIVTTDYDRRIPPYKLSDKVFQSNFAQVFPEDRGVNFAVREGERIAELMSV